MAPVWKRKECDVRVAVRSGASHETLEVRDRTDARGREQHRGERRARLSRRHERARFGRRARGTEVLGRRRGENAARPRADLTDLAPVNASHAPTRPESRRARAATSSTTGLPHLAEGVTRADAAELLPLAGRDPDERGNFGGIAHLSDTSPNRRLRSFVDETRTARESLRSLSPARNPRGSGMRARASASSVGGAADLPADRGSAAPLLFALLAATDLWRGGGSAFPARAAICRKLCCRCGKE